MLEAFAPLFWFFSPFIAILVIVVIANIIQSKIEANSELRRERKLQRDRLKAEQKFELKMRNKSLKTEHERIKQEHEEKLLKIALENQAAAEEQNRRIPKECSHCGAPVNVEDHGICPYCGCNTGVAVIDRKFTDAIKDRVLNRRKK